MFKRNYLDHSAEQCATAIEAVATEAQDIAQISADFRRAQGHRKQSLRDTISAKFDALLSTMLNSFDGSVEPEEIKALFAEHHPLTYSRLSKLPVSTVPLVVVRELIAMHRTPIDRKKLQNWSLFAARYKRAI
jgi:hypothetical protein